MMKTNTNSQTGPVPGAGKNHCQCWEQQKSCDPAGLCPGEQMPPLPGEKPWKAHAAASERKRKGWGAPVAARRSLSP